MAGAKVRSAIALCKTANKIGSLAGRGSSMPGSLALKLCPDILSRIELPETVIAVTGSNGKTSTVEMIAHILTENGLSVAWNKAGSNQTEGVATCLLCDCTADGKVKSDVVLLESDERFARHTFKFFHPKYYVITNLYRDQMTRNGHPEWAHRVIRESIYDDMHLILNADDPQIADYGFGRDDVTWFGADHLAEDTAENTTRYDDGAFCPACGARMEYEYYHYNHAGKYRCTECGFHRPDTDVTITDADYEAQQITINGKYKVHLPFSNIAYCYNTLAAFAACEKAGVAPEKIIEAMEGFISHSKRVESFRVNGKPGYLLVSKHENSVAYDRAIETAARDRRSSSVMVIVDEISRKYFTSETSWIWDIDFEKLNVPQVKQIILAGLYCWDLDTRFKVTGIPKDRIVVCEDLSEAARIMGEADTECFYVMTCFVDQIKFRALKEVEETGE